MRYDAIIIGAGHNGLAAAATLGAKGKRVCVLEAAQQLGGMAQRGQLAGMSIDRLAHGLWGMHRDTLGTLGLKPDDLGQPLPTIALCPAGRHAILDGRQALSVDGSPHPQHAAYAAIMSDLVDFAALLAPLMKRPPPAAPLSLDALFHYAGLGFRLKLMGKKRMREMLRIALSNVSDYALDRLPDGSIAGALAADAVKGSWSGPRSPGTVLSLLYRLTAGGGTLGRPEG